MENRNGKFEGFWKEVFHDKEMSPSSDLWNNLDAHLANQEAKKYRKGIFFYKWVAAAAVFIAFGLGMYSYVKFGNDTVQLVDKTEINDINEKDNNDIIESNGEQLVNNLGKMKQEKTTTAANSRENKNTPSKATPIAALKEKKVIADKGKYTSWGKSGNSLANERLAIEPQSPASTKNLLAFISGKHLELTAHEPENPDIAIDKFVIFSDDPFKKEELKDVWAGIDFSGGQFNPNAGGRINGGAAAAFDNQYDFKAAFNESVEQVTPGNSYSFNVSVGKKIAKRWVLQSGLSYLNYSSNTTTNTYFVNSDNTRIPAFSNLAGDELSNIVAVKNTSNIRLNSALEFISVPIKAGYMVLNKKVSVILLAGISTDFFIANRVKADDTSFADIVTKGGSDSPYNTVHFNGLMSTQVRYRFSENYSLTLEPSYAVAINSLTKIDQYGISLPRVFNLGLGLKYHFR